MDRKISSSLVLYGLNHPISNGLLGSKQTNTEGYWMSSSILFFLFMIAIIVVIFLLYLSVSLFPPLPPLPPRVAITTAPPHCHHLPLCCITAAPYSYSPASSSSAASFSSLFSLLILPTSPGWTCISRHNGIPICKNDDIFS